MSEHPNRFMLPAPLSIPTADPGPIDPHQILARIDVILAVLESRLAML